MKKISIIFNVEGTLNTEQGCGLDSNNLCRFDRSLFFKENGFLQ